MAKFFEPIFVVLLCSAFVSVSGRLCKNNNGMIMDVCPNYNFVWKHICDPQGPAISDANINQVAAEVATNRNVRDSFNTIFVVRDSIQQSKYELVRGRNEADNKCQLKETALKYECTKKLSPPRPTPHSGLK